MLKRGVKLKDYLMSNVFDADDETPRSHRKNEKWKLPKAIVPIEDCLKEFDKSMHLDTGKRATLKNQI